MKLTSKESLAAKAEAYLQDHYMDKFSLDKIAESLYINKNYLSRVFREVTGTTLLHRQHEIRCEKAKKYLEERQLSIEIIACRTGFMSSSHFSRIFRSCEGCTPTQYRNRHYFGR